MSRRRYIFNKYNYEFVDMGLSVKWATCNIGAKSPEEYGWYFQWAGTIPYLPYGYDNGQSLISNKVIVFNFNVDCPYCNGKKNSNGSLVPWYIKYHTREITTLEPMDDAAYVHMGRDCRMPTSSEYTELNNACNKEWIKNYNNTAINGLLLTLKTDSSKTLFFPAGGCIREYDNPNAPYQNNPFNVNYNVYCWTSSIYKVPSYSDSSHLADNMLWYTGKDISTSLLSQSSRYEGMLIRGVLPK